MTGIIPTLTMPAQAAPECDGDLEECEICGELLDDGERCECASPDVEARIYDALERGDD